MGSVHPGEKARIGSLGFGCTELVDAKHAAAFLDAHESAEHVNAAFFLTDPPRQNGTDLWVAWQYLSFVDFK